MRYHENYKPSCQEHRQCGDRLHGIGFVGRSGSGGEYRFRTIKPVPYPGRPAPHIHVKVKRGERELLTTQIFVRGHEGNLRDGIVNSARDLVDRELLMADFKPIADSKIGEVACQFDIVLGRTPDENAFRSRR